jgi:hypothetical protein
VKPVCTFDADAHRYTINGREVPSVTTVLRAVIPQWQASEWHMQRGTAVHACAALIARGVEFEHDSQIGGQVAACRLFFEEVRPQVIHVERQVYSPLYGFAGTLDLAAEITGEVCLTDWKAALSKVIQWQLGAYAIALKETTGETVRQGFGVELRDNGEYQIGESYDLTRAGREFLAILGTYNCMKREGMI